MDRRATAAETTKGARVERLSLAAAIKRALEPDAPRLVELEAALARAREDGREAGGAGSR